MSPTAKLNRNIKLLQTAMVAREALFILPVLVPFYALKGVGLSGFFLIEALFTLSLVLVQTPAAYLSDRYARRPQIILGSTLWTAAHVVLWQGYGFGTVLVAELLMGVGLALWANNAEAMLFESLEAAGRKAEHYRQLSKQRGWQSYITALCTAIGGWLFTLNDMLPVALTTLTGGLAMLCCLGLIEPPRRKRTHANPWKDLLRVNAYILHGHPELKWLMLYPAVLSSLTLVMFWAMQPWLQGMGLNATVIGLMLAGHFVLRGACNHAAPWLVHHLSVAGAFALSFSTVVTGLVGMGIFHTPWAFPLAMLGCGFSFVLTDTLVRELLHRRLTSDLRASALAAYGLLGRCTSIGCLIIVGRWAESYDASTAMLLTLLFALPLAWPLVKLLSLPTLEKHL